MPFWEDGAVERGTRLAAEHPIRVSPQDGSVRIPRKASRPMNLSIAPQLKAPGSGCTHFQLSRKRLVRTRASSIPSLN